MLEGRERAGPHGQCYLCPRTLAQEASVGSTGSADFLSYDQDLHA
jgi:hypothetical protein